MNENHIQVIPESINSIKKLLNEMNINSYDPKVIDQLLNCAFSISQELLVKSNEYARIDSRNKICENDAKIAISNYFERNIINQNSNILNRMISNEINSLPLPTFPNKGVSKIWLPNEYDMSITPNWQNDLRSIRININNEEDKLSNNRSDDIDENK